MSYYLCSSLKPDCLFWSQNKQHKITDFDALYEIINGQVCRKSDQALVILLGYNPILSVSVLWDTPVLFRLQVWPISLLILGIGSLTRDL
jgi:hypothetical protein